VILFAQNPKPQSNQEEKHQPKPNEERFYKALQNCQDNENHGKTKKLSQTKGDSSLV